MDYKEISEPEFKMYGSRHAVVGMFALVQMMTSILLNTLTPIASYLTEVYGYDPVVINLGSLLFALMHPLFTFPAAYLIDGFGTRNGIFLGSLLGIIGVSIRLFCNTSFVFVIVGQVIAGIGRPFILNCQAKISANWYTA
jgi:MFS transporter, FLVCR family, feline leukemia virus subgroup C receptor-related protein